jgi:hypothetical protein
MTLIKPFQRKATIRASSCPTTADLHWAAGLLEGEGCFFSHPHSGSQQITVGMTDNDIILRLQQLFGGRVTEKTPKNPKHKIQWHWTIHGSRARGVMMTLYRLFGTRRQAKIFEVLSAKSPVEA